MKRIYMTVGLLSAFAFGSMAQSVDIEAYIQRPTAGTVISPGETLDTSKVVCALFYNGPDDIYSGTDYITFMTPFSVPANDSQFYLDGVAFQNDITIDDTGVLFVFPNNNEIGAGHIAPFNLAADSISYLYDWDLYNLQDSFVLVDPPYVTGTSYGFFFRSFGVRDQTTGDAVATDPVPENNRAVVKIVWGQGGTGIGNMIAANKHAEIDVYPNPATSVINFSFDFEKNSHAQAVLRDVTGKIVFVKNYGKAVTGTQKYSIDISKFAAGMYSLEFNTDEHTAVTKFNIVK